MIEKRELKSYALLGLCAAIPAIGATKEAKVFERPNVILINLDDMGWGDPSCYGGTLIQTPNIDRLASEGVRFTDGYVSAPVSGPSRQGLLLGSHQQRHGVQWNHDTWNIPGERDDERIIPEEAIFINEAFQDAGYVTAMAGKIGVPDHAPFDYEFSMAFNGTSFFPDENGEYERAKTKSIMAWWGPEGDDQGEYLTDKCTRECIEFIEEQKDENPFFFYLAYNAPHTPLHAKRSDLPRVEHITTEAGRLYAAMVLAVDDNIGRLLDYLEKEELRENTIVVFLSDNGPANPYHLRVPTWWREGDPYHILGQRGGLNGYKGTLWESGIRIPYIVSWPGVIPQGETNSMAVSTMDIFPTLCSAAHIPAPDNGQLDGVDLMPTLTGGYTGEPHDALYWYANRMGAVRMGDWKFLVEDGKHYLFNLKEDMGETTNVARENPEVMQEIFAKYINFRNQMPPCRNPFIRPIDIPDPAVFEIEVREAPTK